MRKYRKLSFERLWQLRKKDASLAEEQFNRTYEFYDQWVNITEEQDYYDDEENLDTIVSLENFTIAKVNIFYSLSYNLNSLINLAYRRLTLVPC